MSVFERRLEEPRAEESVERGREVEREGIVDEARRARRTRRESMGVVVVCTRASTGRLRRVAQVDGEEVVAKELALVER
jgi:hypothetical protein